ncbi:MAG: hypothetical protein MPW14_25850 (plasmid) [Candidatus Manganitrophus sp.]|nr:MAG: hypothetical protein MPW14_25850 [Candidatus Manganitrophus sp.]
MEQHPPGQQQNVIKKFFIDRTGRVTFYTRHSEKKKADDPGVYAFSDPLDSGKTSLEQLYLQN